MEPIVNRLRKRARHAFDARKVVDAGARDGLQPAELAQEIAAPLRAQTRNFIER
jgi:hypothetical protein